MNVEKKAEFQAVIFAGGAGAHLYPFSDDTPKCLMPVANIPLLRFQLELLEKNKFSDAIVVIQKSQGKQFAEYINGVYKGPVNVQLEFIDEPVGTAEVLRRIKDKIKSDFLVVSGDLVTDARIDLLANIHRLHDASLVALFAPPALPNAAQIAAAEAAAVEKATAQSKLSDAELKKQKKKAAEDAKKPDLESIHSYYVGFDPAEAIPLPLEAASDPSTGHAHRLLYFSAAADVEESFTIRKAMLRRHPCMRVNTRLRDAHVYLFRHWILDLLDAVPLIESIQGDLIPYLLSKQFSSKAAPVNIDIEPQHSDAYARSSAPLPEPSLDKDHDSIRCYAYIAPAWAVVERVNTLPQLRLVNRAMAAHEYTALAHLLQTRSQFNEVLAASPNATVGRECLIGEGSEFGERATLKNCVVGKHCRIKAQARLTNCILMDYAYVEERVTLNNCIIGRNAKVLAQCTLTDCSVGADFEVPACTNQKDGTLANDAIEDDE